MRFNESRNVFSGRVMGSDYGTARIVGFMGFREWGFSDWDKEAVDDTRGENESAKVVGNL